MSAIKESAKKLIERLPENATWDDLIYELYVRKKVQIALDSIESGKTTSHEEVKKRFLGQ